jgi:hypothetical protein
MGIWCNKIVVKHGEIAGKGEEYYEGKYRKKGTHRVRDGFDYLVNEDGNN